LNYSTADCQENDTTHSDTDIIHGSRGQYKNRNHCFTAGAIFISSVNMNLQRKT